MLWHQWCLLGRVVNDEKRLFTRVSAQCHNVLEDYAALAVAVLYLARKEAAERDAEAGAK